MKDDRVGIAKITRPKTRRIFLRKRLFKLLDESLNQQITWISGPAGCGKTSLISSYLDNRSIPCIWYQVDESDSDIASFFYYLGLAVKSAVPSRRAPLPLFTPEYLAGLPTFTLRFFESLSARIEAPFCLVFDNCHRVAAESAFHSIILNALSAISDCVHVLLISRTEAPAAYARLKANHQMGFIAWKDIRFTQKESESLIRFHAPEIKAKETMDRLYKITDGWAAGLILLSEGMNRGIEVESIEISAPEEIMDYFGSESFGSLNRGFRNFLMKTSFLPKMTARTAQEITGISDAGSILKTLTNNNYFLEKLHLTEPVYQYHHLFRSFLVSQARKHFRRKQFSDLQQRAAQLLTASGYFDEAAFIFSEEKNWDELKKLILRQAPEMAAQGRLKSLEEWLDRLPEDQMQMPPWLLYWKGICRLPYNPTEACAHLKNAFRLFESLRDDAGTYRAWSGIIDSIYYEYDDFTQFDEWIEWLDRRLLDHPVFPSIEIEARVAASAAWVFAWRWLDPRRNDEWLKRAFELSAKIMDPGLQLQNYITAMLHYVMAGEIAKLNMVAEEAKKFILSDAATPLNLLSWKFLDVVHRENVTEDPNLTAQALHEGFEIANKNGVHIMDHMLIAHGAYVELSLGNLEKAKAYLQKMGMLLDPRQRNTLGHYHFLSGWCEFLSNHISQAEFHAEKGVEVSALTGTPIPETICRMLLSQVLHRKKRYKEAAAQMAKAKRLVEKCGFYVFKYHIPITEAQFALDRGEEEKCVQALHKGLSFGKSRGLKTMLFIWQPSVMARLCSIALERGVETDYVRDIIRTFHLPPDIDSWATEGWPWPLKIYTSGRFGILKDGNPIRFSGKIQEKPILMLKVLLALGGREVNEEDLSDILWPDADGDAAHISFETTLHRLRTLIGCPEALQFHHGRLTLESSHCWIDIWAFERLLGMADEKLREERVEESIAYIQKAIRLYQGPFLAEAGEQSWIMSIRARLRSKFIRNVIRVGNHWRRSGHWENALECYQKGLEVDNMAEEFCQGIMICYQKLGLHANALSLCDRFEKRLMTVQGIELSPKTEALRDALLTVRQSRKTANQTPNRNLHLVRK
jgi:LuxR family transcriptional regulator, maltose regulon positive regulatory protein